MSTKDDDVELALAYYEHQYDRVAKLEEQRLTFTNIIITLTVVALTFGFSSAQGLTLVNGLILPGLMILLNFLGAIYTWRTLQFINIHRERAKDILKIYAEKVYEVDSLKPIPTTRLGLAKIQLLTHVVLTIPPLVLIITYVWNIL